MPENLANYKLLQTKMFGALHQAQQRAAGSGVRAGDRQIDLNGSNPDAGPVSRSYWNCNAPLLLDIKDSLMVYKLEASTQKVEDDFYDLFLQIGSEDEDKR